MTLRPGTRNPQFLLLASALALGVGMTVLILQHEDAVAAAVTVLTLGALGIGAAMLGSERSERRQLAAIYCTALGLRVAAAILIQAWNPRFFSLDQGPYFNMGNALASQWHAQKTWPSLGWIVAGPGNRFPELWAVWSYFVGPSRAALSILVGVAGALSATRVYRLGKEIFGEPAGLWAGWMAACWPSLIVWAAQGVRDPLVIWLWCEVGLAIVRVCRGRALPGLAGLALAIYGLTLLRPYAAALAATGACLPCVLAFGGRAKGLKLVAAGVVGLSLLAGGLGFLGSSYMAGKDLEVAAGIRESFRGGGSSFAGEADFSDYSSALRYLPVGVAYFIFAPFPWQTGSALQMSALVEQPIWYLALALAAYGLVAGVRRLGAEAFIGAGVALPAILFYGLVMSNIGTGFRDRAQLTAIVFAYAANGVFAWREAAREQRVGRQPGAGFAGTLSESG
jgi:hypothetical protein